MTWTKNGNGNWVFGDGRQLGVPDTFYLIAIEEKRSRFDKTRILYSVVSFGTNEHVYFQDLTLKRFKSREHAQNFADKLAALLNESED